MDDFSSITSGMLTPTSSITQCDINQKRILDKTVVMVYEVSRLESNVKFGCKNYVYANQLPKEKTGTDYDSIRSLAGYKILAWFDIHKPHQAMTINNDKQLIVALEELYGTLSCQSATQRINLFLGGTDTMNLVARAYRGESLFEMRG